ncbi:MAG: acyl-CoA dehydrogenase [Myxococcales bacterium]|nr:acyl-CoA dehydrogenase [Myxococcales bacterium]
MDLDDLQLGPERRAMVETVRRFVQREVRPSVRALEHADAYPTALVERMRELGLFGMGVPVEYGGLGLDTQAYALVFEELSRGWMSLAGVLGTHGILCHLLARFGTESQRSEWLPRLASGELRGGLALTEPEGGSDVAALRTTARRDGDAYVLDGAKQFITNTHEGSVFAVVARTGGAGAGGLSAFVVVKTPERAATLIEGAPLKKLGYKGLKTSSLTFDGCRVPEGCLIGGEEGRGFAQVMSGLELGRINVAARAVGVARAALEDSLAYAKERVTFGKPIIEHQAIGHKLADMATEIAAARHLYLAAAAKRDRGERCDLEAAMAKLFASTMCTRATLEGIQIHGGYGYTDAYDVERYYRDAPLFTVGEGTNEILRTVIARALARRDP